MKTRTAFFIVACVVAGLLLYLRATDQIGPHAPLVQPQPASAEYGTAPKRITDMMAGDGQALTEEIDEQRKRPTAPILTERRDRR